MGLRINFAQLPKIGITQKEYYLLLALYANPNFPYNEATLSFYSTLLSKEYVSVNNGILNLTTSGRRIVKTTAYQVDDTEYSFSVEALAKKLRELFPEGKKDMTPYYWRGNSREIEAKLSDFLKKNPEYTEEQILNATNRYLESYKSRGDLTFMQLLKYFIEKDGNSTLLTFLENYKEDEVNRPTGDWTSNLI